MLVVLLGLTWVFGFLYVSADGIIMAYIFTILNSLQGVFIFIFHCIGNEKVMGELIFYSCLETATSLTNLKKNFVFIVCKFLTTGSKGI